MSLTPRYRGNRLTLMSRTHWIVPTVAVALIPALALVSQAQQPQQAPAPGRGTAETAVRPPLFFREEWKQPPYTGQLTDENRRITPAAVTNPNLEIQLYGAASHNIEVAEHEGRHDLWTGMAPSPVAVTLRDKTNYFNLTGLARLRWITRTNALHALHPVLRLADGTLIAGSHVDSNEGEFLESEIAFDNQRWFKLDPQKVVTGTEVNHPDFSRVDEIGYADLMPGAGHGIAGSSNMSAIELYAKAVPRTAR